MNPIGTKISFFFFMFVPHFIKPYNTIQRTTEFKFNYFHLQAESRVKTRRVLKVTPDTAEYLLYDIGFHPSKNTLKLNFSKKMISLDKYVCKYL